MKKINLFLLATFIFLTSCASFDSNMSRKLADYNFINQDEQEVGLIYLDGH